MANATTLSIKTDPETKALMQQATERIGLSVNAFVIMVAKNAAESDEIIIKNPAAAERAALAQALQYNTSHDAEMDWETLKAHYGV
ncbi:MAG: DUF1778 domain-containing protein [Candidatus Sericytochromatia bacterium]|nr:DUF1778 domain-containing protein [Candidatus Sericytochromatia bacterium]